MPLLFILILVIQWCGTTVSVGFTVKSLPGLEGPLPFHLETGYVGLDDKREKQIFYYFTQSERNPRDDPLLVWVPSGHRCSALSDISGNGPFNFEPAENGDTIPNLVLNPNSLTKVANIIYPDVPVGTGFSYPEPDYMPDTISAKDTYQFLRKWLVDHPEFLSNPLYLGGVSYSGKMIPIIAQLISDGIDIGNEPSINLKGYIIGNPGTNMTSDQNSRIDFAHGMALISDELHQSVEKNCGGNYVDVDPINIECIKDLEAVSECTSRLNPINILKSTCETTTHRDLLEGEQSKNVLISSSLIRASECKDYEESLPTSWANDDKVQTALGVRKGAVQEWIRCNIEMNYVEDVKTSTQYISSLSKKGYRALIYNGDHDMLVPFLSPQAWLKSLNFPISDDWRPWLVNRDVAGYTRRFVPNITFVTVKAAGHNAIGSKPEECFVMIKRWLSYQDL